jgi:hypothetical protein
MTCRSVLGWAAVAAANAAEPVCIDVLVAAAADFKRQGRLAQALSDPASAAAAAVSGAHCHYTLARHFLCELVLLQQQKASSAATDSAAAGAGSDSSSSDDDSDDSDTDSDASVPQHRQPSAAQGSSEEELRSSAQAHTDAAKERLGVWLQYGIAVGDTPAQIHAHLCLAQVAALQVQLNDAASGVTAADSAASSSRDLRSSLQSSFKGLAAVAAAALAVSAVQKHTAAALALCADSGAVLLQGAVQACIDAL